MRAQTDTCSRRVIPVSVSDKQGQIVPGLFAGDFQASIKGKSIKILSVAPNDQPVRVMIVLDRSGSMLKDESIWNEYLAAGVALVSHLPPKSFVGLTAFADKILGSVPFTTDSVAFRQEISGLSSVPPAVRKKGGSTALFDALVAAATQFDPPQPGDSLYALSDGDDDASRITHESAVKTLESKGVRLFAFSVAAGESPVDHRVRKQFGDMARRTGGDLITVSRKLTAASGRLSDTSGNPTEAAKWLEAQFRQIFDFYRVEIKLPVRNEKREALSLKLTDPNKQGIELTYPPDLPGCAPETSK